MDDKLNQNKMKRTPISIKKQKEICLLAGIDYAGSYEGETQKNLDELSRLIETAGGIADRRFTQSLTKPDNITFFQKGKLQQIKDHIQENRVDAVVFDEELTPVQLKNIENFLNIKIIDRTELILTIFSNNASSKLAKLQIELAKLQYTLPRLQRMWTHLERQKGGIGLKGPGERQIELDRRLLLKRMTKIKNDLSIIKQGINIRRKKRRDEFKVSLAGYTNSGKSTLLSTLSYSDVYIEDKLFSTLDALIRKVALNEQRNILVSDTVGFIRKLPHQLIESFYTTLSEVLNSDMVLIVIDISQKDFLKRLEAVKSVLHEIGAHNIPGFIVLNKMDLIDKETLTIRKASLNEDHIVISAKGNKNIEQLKEKILNSIRNDEVFTEFRIDSNDKTLLNRIYNNTEVVNSEYQNDRKMLMLKCYVKRENLPMFNGYIVH